MEVIILNGPEQLKCFFLVERSLIKWLVNSMYLWTLNMPIGEPKMHKLGIDCGIAWNLRSVVVWFCYQLLNLFRNRPRNFTLVLTIWSKFMVFIKLISPWVSVICLWKIIKTSLRAYVKNSIVISPSPLMLKLWRNNEILCMSLTSSRLPKILDPVKSQILASQYLPCEVFGRLR